MKTFLDYLTGWTVKERRNYALAVFLLAFVLGAVLLYLGTDGFTSMADFLRFHGRQRKFFWGLLIGSGMLSGFLLMDHAPMLRRIFRAGVPRTVLLVIFVGILTVIPFYLYNLIALLLQICSAHRAKEDKDPWD